jgi:hypothetical protein
VAFGHETSGTATHCAPSLSSDLQGSAPVVAALLDCQPGGSAKRTEIAAQLGPDDLKPADPEAVARLRGYLKKTNVPQGPAQAPMLVVYGGQNSVIPQHGLIAPSTAPARWVTRPASTSDRQISSDRLIPLLRWAGSKTGSVRFRRQMTANRLQLLIHRWEAAHDGAHR